MFRLLDVTVIRPHMDIGKKGNICHCSLWFEITYFTLCNSVEIIYRNMAVKKDRMYKM